MAIIGQLVGALPGAVSQGFIWGILAIGVYLTFRILDIADLTVDGSFATGGAVGVMCLLNGWNPLAAVFMAFLAGILTGAVTGIFHVFMGIPAILSGILTQLGLYSVNLKIMGKANQSINVNSTELLIFLRWIKERSIRNPMITVGIMILVLIVFLYWFFGTEMGCAIRATGANIQMSRAQGINTNFNKILGLMLSNGLVALSGSLLAQYNGFADVNMGRGAIVIGLAAIIIGEAIFGKIFRNFGLKLLYVVFGSVIYYIVVQAVITMKLDPNLLKLFSALIVAVFLAIPFWKSKLAEKNAKL